MTDDEAIKIASEVFHDIPKDAPGREDFLGYALWNHTGWPWFFDSDDIETELRAQLEAYRDNKTEDVA